MAFVLPPNLARFAKKIHSQNGEDGIIEAVFGAIPPRSRYFVEFGAGPNWLDTDYAHGIEANCVLLRKMGWDGLMMDGRSHPSEHGIVQEFITPLNINSTFRKHGVPETVDLISIDVDGQDFWIWLACLYRPVLYIIEYNSTFRDIDQCVTTEYKPDAVWDGTNYFGASIGALLKLGRDKGYKLVHANGINAFFVRQDLLANPQDFADSRICEFLDLHAPDLSGRPWITV